MNGKFDMARATLASSSPPLSEAEIAWRNTWLTMEEAGEYLRYKGESAAHSAYNFLQRHKVALRKRGNFVLVRRGAIDDLLERRETEFVTRARQVARR